MRSPVRVIAGVALFLTPLVARADWPMIQHDPQRGGASSGAARLEHPAIAWSRYLGGAIGSGQITTADVNGDGTADVLMARGGRLVARRGDDTPEWESAAIGVGGIGTIADLNGDGELDIVAGGGNFIAVFGGRDGRLEWRSAPGAFGALGAVLIADFNGDGRLDLYATDVGCGFVGSLGDVAYAYTFGRGFGSGTSDSTTQLWQLERGRDYTCGEADVLVDFTGDGHPDVVAFSSTQAWVYDGTTGRKISSGDDANPVFGAYALGFSIPYGVLTTNVIDVDGDGRPEVVGYTNNPYAPMINSRAAFVLGYDANRPQAQRLFVRWVQGVASLANDQHLFVGHSAADIDGDGRVEIVTTFDVQGAGPTTYVRRGADGTVLAQLAGVRIAGIYNTGGGDHPLVVVARGADLEAYRFAALPLAGTATPLFTVPNATVITTSDHAPAVDAAGAPPLTLPDADGVHQALVLRRDNSLLLYSTTGAAPHLVATYTPDSGILGSIVASNNVGTTGAGLLVSRTDGRVFALDARLNVLDFGDPERPLQGLRTGGYYSGGCGSLDAPVVARLDGTADSVLSRDARGYLLRLEANHANRVVPPTQTWEWAGAGQPEVLDVDADGHADVLAITDTANAATRRTVTVRRNGGTTALWTSTPLARATEGIAGDVVPLAQAGGATHFALLTQDLGDGNGRIYVLGPDGMVGTVTSPIYIADSGRGQLAAMDLDGDGLDDPVVNLIHYMHGFSARTGALVAYGEDGYAQMPVVVRGRAGNVDVILASGLSSDFGASLTPGGAMAPLAVTPRWGLAGSPPSTFCFPAALSCPDGLRFATARMNSSHLVVADATTGAIRGELVLAGGELFATDDAQRAAGVASGTLGNVSGIRVLTGTTGAFVVGSTDGYLYAVDACAAAPRLVWSVNLGAPVGQPVFGDTDGDGDEEIAVTASDGNLYGIDTQRFDAPGFVYDTDPDHGFPDTDVDEIEGLAVHALWSSVPGALGYEWALYTSGGTPITHRAGAPDNPFIPAGASESRATVTDGLTYGVRYYFVVRAIGPDGASSETLSDGVRILPLGMPLPDGGTGTDSGVRSDGGMGADAGSASDAGRTRHLQLIGGGCGPCAVRGGGAGGRTPRTGLFAAGAVVAGAFRRRRRLRAARGSNIPVG